MNVEKIAELLGKDSDYLLGFKTPKVKKDQLHIPGLGQVLPKILSRCSFPVNANRQLKPPIITKKTDIRLKEPPFVPDTFNNPIKIGAKVVSHFRYVIFQMAEVAVCINSRKSWLLDISVQLFWRFSRDNSLGRPENCCNLKEILIL